MQHDSSSKLFFIFILLCGLCSSRPAYAYLFPKCLGLLSNPEAMNLAKATVGLTVHRKPLGMLCTGFRLNQQLVVTAAHCIADRNSPYTQVVESIDVHLLEANLINTKTHSESIASISLYYPRLGRGVVASPLWDYFTDIAIIKFTNLPPPLVNVTTELLIDDVFELNDYIFRTDAQQKKFVYGFGWGSLKLFHAGEIADCANLLAPNHIHYISYLKLAKTTLMKFVNNTLSCADPNHIYTTEPTHFLYTAADIAKENSYYKTTLDDDYASIYQVLKIDQAYALPGDSGGPLLICKAKDSGCKFVGIDRNGDNTNPSLGYYTNFTSIYFKGILDEALHESEPLCGK